MWLPQRLIAEDEDGSYRVLRDRPARIMELVESRVRRAADCVGVSIQLEEAKSGMSPLAAAPKSPPTKPFCEAVRNASKFTFEAFNPAKAHFAGGGKSRCLIRSCIPNWQITIMSLDVSGMRAARGICRW